MRADFTAIRRRLATAKKDLDELRAEVNAFMDPPPWRLERQDTGLSESLVSFVDREPDPEWGDRIGYIAYKVRSALDQLVTQLIVDGGKEPRGNTQFPIFAESAGYLTNRRDRKSQRDVMLHGVSSRHRTVIDALQPYQRGAQARRDPLFILNSIGNRDKHNDTHAVWGAVAGTRHRIIRPDGVTWTISINKDDDPLPLIDGQVLLGVESQLGTELTEKMRMEVDEIRVGLAFEGKVIVTLDHIERALLHVAGIVDRFENRIRNRNP